MNDRRFLSILNDVARDLGPQLRQGQGRAAETALVAAWARFLQGCVERGVSVGDPRWRLLEMRSAGGQLRFLLPESGEERAPDDAGDFSVGLALLMAMLGREGDG